MKLNLFGLALLPRCISAAPTAMYVNSTTVFATVSYPNGTTMTTTVPYNNNISAAPVNSYPISTIVETTEAHPEDTSANSTYVISEVKRDYPYASRYNGCFYDLHVRGVRFWGSLPLGNGLTTVSQQSDIGYWCSITFDRGKSGDDKVNSCTWVHKSGPSPSDKRCLPGFGTLVMTPISA